MLGGSAGLPWCEYAARCCLSTQGTAPLDEGSIVCTAERKVIGCIDEVFGPVPRPMYTVRVLLCGCCSPPPRDPARVVVCCGIASLLAVRSSCYSRWSRWTTARCCCSRAAALCGHGHARMGGVSVPACCAVPPQIRFPVGHDMASLGLEKGTKVFFSAGLSKTIFTAVGAGRGGEKGYLDAGGGVVVLSPVSCALSVPFLPCDS
jgi:hypothetical protein